MGRYIINRFLQVIPVFIGITLITFVLAHSIPGSPLTSEKLSGAARKQIEASYGLDRPIYEQYFIYVFNFLRGDWGPSFERKGTQTVTEILFGYSTNPNQTADMPFWLQLTLIGLAAGVVVVGVSLAWGQAKKVEWLALFRRWIIPTVLAALVGYLIYVIFTMDTTKAGGFLFSLRLGIMAFAFMLLVGIPLGIIAALKQNSWVDYLVSVVALIGFSIPSFVLGLLALIAIVLINAWLGTNFSIAPSSPTTMELILPAILLGAREASIIARLTRSSMLEVIRQDYMRTAQAKGLNNRRVAIGHGLKNAFIPILTVLGDRMAGLLTGSVTIERVFNIPGIGYYFVSSILVLDYPMILGTTVLYAMMVVFINLLVDLLYGYFDPRISYSKGSAF
jgi:ABC-type dipeptide/oligopeptide/nickel transport system permease component